MTIAKFLITGINQTLCEDFIAGFTDEKHHLVINDKLTLHLLPASTTSDLWEDALEGCLGAVLVMENEFHFAPQIIETMQGYKPNLPFIITVIAEQKPSPDTLQDVRDFFPENTEIKVFPCIKNDAQSAQNVLLALIYQILS